MKAACSRCPHDKEDHWPECLAPYNDPASGVPSKCPCPEFSKDPKTIADHLEAKLLHREMAGTVQDILDAGGILSDDYSNRYFFKDGSDCHFCVRCGVGFDWDEGCCLPD